MNFIQKKDNWEIIDKNTQMFKVIYNLFVDQLLISQQQIRSLKKTNGNLKEQVQKLNEQNKFLIQEKQSMMNDYSTSVESIKDEITKKQNEIYHLKQNTFSPLMNQKLIEKQLRIQIEREFEELFESKQKRIQQLQHINDKLVFDKQVDNQKYLIKVQSLQKQLKQMQNLHMVHFLINLQIEIQNYANKTYQNSQQNKISEEQSLIRKLKRQIDELRINLDHAQQELNQSLIEKNIIHRQLSSLIMKSNKQKQSFLEEIRIVNLQLKQSTGKSQIAKNQRSQSNFREKEREIKQLKDKIQDLRRQNNRKDQLLSEFQIQMTEKQGYITKIKQMSSKYQHDKINQLRIQKDSLQREINQLKSSNQLIRRQNLDLMNNITETQNKNIKSFKQNNQIINKKYVEEINKNIIHNKNFNKQIQIGSKQTYDGQNQLDNSFGQAHIIKSPQNNNNNKIPSNYKSDSLQSQKNYYELKINQQIQRNKQLGVKYVEMKKKYRNLQQKFKQANNKVVELLKTKIQLGSPTAASRKLIQFPISPNYQYSKSPQIVSSTTNNKFFHSIAHSQTQGQMGVIRNVMISPENKTELNNTSENMKKAERSTSSKGDRSFYDRSIKVKTSHKFRQIKCLNHDGDHVDCSHSPLKHA